MLQYSPPVLSPLIPADGNWDGINWILAEDWKVYYEKNLIRLEMTLKRGFVTDGGSIPQIFQGLCKPLGKYLPAFLVHDALYATEYLSRAEADRLLLEIMAELGAGRLWRHWVWSAVRLGGARIWQGHTYESITAGRKLIDGGFERKGTHHLPTFTQPPERFES